MTDIEFDECFDAYQWSAERIQLVVVQLQVLDSSHWLTYNLETNRKTEYYIIVIYYS